MIRAKKLKDTLLMESQSKIDNAKIPQYQIDEPFKISKREVNGRLAQLFGTTGSIGIVKEDYTNPDTVREGPYSEPKNLH